MSKNHLVNQKSNFGRTKKSRNATRSTRLQRDLFHKRQTSDNHKITKLLNGKKQISCQIQHKMKSKTSKKRLSTFGRQQKHLILKKRRVVLLTICCISIFLIIILTVGLSYLIPILNRFNYFNQQFHDIFQNSSVDESGKPMYPNYNYRKTNNNDVHNEYDETFMHANAFGDDLRNTHWKDEQKAKGTNTKPQFDYYYAMMEMEKNMFQVMPHYESQLQFNAAKLAQHSKQYQNSLPIKLLLNKGWFASPGLSSDQKQAGSTGFYVNDDPTKTDSNNNADNPSTHKPSGFFSDSEWIIKQFVKSFSIQPAAPYGQTHPEVESSLAKYNALFSPGGKSEFYNKALKPGSRYATGELYRPKDVKGNTKDIGIGIIDKGKETKDNLISDGFISRTLASFSTNYAFTVQNYFLNPIRYELNPTTTDGMAAMIRNHKVSFDNLLWLFYNRIVVNLAATLFRQAIFAPMLFTEGNTLSKSAYTNKSKTDNQASSGILPVANSLLTQGFSDGSDNQSVFYPINKNNTIRPVRNDKFWMPLINGTKINSWLFIDGFKNPLGGLSPKYFPKYRLLPIFKHAADVVLISDLLDELNYVMFAQVEQILIKQHLHNVDHNWTILAEAEQAFKYYFTTFTNVNDGENVTNDKTSKTSKTSKNSKADESFFQARGDFYAAADLSNPEHSEVSDVTTLTKPLLATKYTFNGDSKNSVPYDNYFDYLCANCPALLNAKINGDVTWTARINKTLFQVMSGQMLQFDYYAQETDIPNLQIFLQAHNKQFLPLLENYAPASKYFSAVTTYFSASSKIITWHS